MAAQFYFYYNKPFYLTMFPKVNQNLRSMGCPFKKDGKDLWQFVWVAQWGLR